MALAKSLYAIPTWTRTVALVREHGTLREAITDGEAPSVYACYRFATKLRVYSHLLDACTARVTAALHERTPGMGRDVAIDGSDMPAYANGQRYLSKNGPERERYADPDASWGHRSAVSTRKGGGFYGYKVHAAVCAVTGLPLAWTVETASAAEANFALGLIDATRERGFDVRTAIMDKGYVNGPIHDGCMDRDVAPVTALRETERVKRGEHRPPCCEHGEWTFAGADYKRRATKWRCPTGECQPASTTARSPGVRSSPTGARARRRCDDRGDRPRDQPPDLRLPAMRRSPWGGVSGSDQRREAKAAGGRHARRARLGPAAMPDVSQPAVGALPDAQRPGGPPAAHRTAKGATVDEEEPVNEPDDDPIEGVMARSQERRQRFERFLDALRAGDPAFAEASALYPPDMGEWQAATYLLTGCGEVWTALGAAVLEDRSIGPVVQELAAPRRAWSASEGAVMEWAAHFWDVDRWPAKFPYVFEEFYFQRWITALHLRRTAPPALTVTRSSAAPEGPSR